MSAVVPSGAEGALPFHGEPPCLDQFRKQAKELLQRALQGEPSALSSLRELNSPALARPRLRLADAQHAIARREGFANWARLRKAVIAAETDALVLEIRKGDRNAVSRRLHRLPELAKNLSLDGETLLHVAATEGKASLAEVLLRHGADPRQKYGHSAHTALSWAITVGSFEFAEEMVRLGDVPDLFCAAGMGDLARVRTFWAGDQLLPGASYSGSSRFAADGTRLPRPPELPKDQISDALYIASRHGRYEVAEWLLHRGADPNFRGYIGGTALHWAEFSGNSELADVIRQAGGSDELEDFEFRARPRAFAILVAAGWGMTSRLSSLLDARPADVDVLGGWGTPLNECARAGQLETAKILLARGADPTRLNHRGETPFEVAHHRGHTAVAALLAAEA